MDRLQRFQGPNQHKCAVASQQHQVRIDIVGARDGVQYQVETAGSVFHCLRIAGQQHMVRT
ncbi:hypothetical protein D3C76_1033440 [compost metagenome]